MRLIDAKLMENHIMESKVFTQYFKELVQALIWGEDTVDAVPVVRGEWVLIGTNEHDYETSVEEKCSLCGRYVYRYDTEIQDKYCPNCGAKMGVEIKGEA